MDTHRGRIGFKRGAVIALRSCVAFVLALAMVPLVNEAGGQLGDAIGLASGGDRRLSWDLAWVLIAGVAANWLVVKLAPCARRPHAVFLFVVMLAIHVQAVRMLGNDWPRWFSAGLLLCPPLQTWLGAAWALRQPRARQA